MAIHKWKLRYMEPTVIIKQYHKTIEFTDAEVLAALEITDQESATLEQLRIYCYGQIGLLMQDDANVVSEENVEQYEQQLFEFNEHLGADVEPLDEDATLWALAHGIE